MVIMGRFYMKSLSFGQSALVSPRVMLGVGAVLVVSLFGGTGCNLSYSLTGMYVEPGIGLTCVGFGMTAQYNAYGTYTEGGHATKIEDITDQVSWTVSLPQLATINTSGLATADSSSSGYYGTTNIVATTNGEFGNLTTDSNLEVSTQCVAPSTAVVKHYSLHIVTGNSSVAVGDTLQPLAVVRYPDNSRTIDLFSGVTWSSSDSNVASVDARGVITGVAPGDAVITAQAKAPDGEMVSTTQTVHIEASQQNQ
jgi:trimeric autotransporter adhesin